jgi:integral membrane protein
MTKAFRWLAFFEGISFLMLLFVAMPLKYWMGMPQATRVAGMAHGFLFLGYCLLAFLLASEKKWSRSQHLLAYVAAILPFGTFVFDRRFMAR